MKFNSFCLLSTVFIFCLSCKNNTRLNYSIDEIKDPEPISISLENLEIKGNLKNFKVEKSSFEKEPNLHLFTFKFSAEIPSELPPVSINFKFPSIDINGFWNPKISADKVNYYNSAVNSKATVNAPILSFYNNELNNRITIALSDALNQSEIVSYLKEEDVFFHPRIQLFKEKLPKTKEYTIQLRVDTRNIPYYDALDNVASWWAIDLDYTPMSVPDNAKNPMYSTWYSYHQSISAEEIVAECKIAKTLGCEAVIIDDGWQTNDGNRGYAYTGDWNPDRIPDMKGFVDAIHKEGMQFILWYSLPFVGEKAKIFNHFKGKYLWHWKEQGTYVLDPRYPEVREYIINTYVDAMNEWKVDGFKIDFIARFVPREDTEISKENGRDFASVYNATDALMTEITEKLSAINPKVLIEFRQPYIGPLMRKYGNMLRGVDAPNNAVSNKIETTNLRLLSQNTAVHSDMFIWRKEEPVEIAALQILNILYSVPQLSVKLAEIPEGHIEMIRFWFNYWNENKAILLDGKFIPSNPGSNYPILTATKNQHQISTLYEHIVVKVEGKITKLDIINATSSKSVVFDIQNSKKAHIKVMDCKGITIFEGRTTFQEGINQINIPESGMAKITFN